MKYFFLILFLALFFHTAFSQDQTISIEWEVKKDSTIKRPENVSPRAHLFVSDQDQFKVYFWVQYLGIVGDDNQIHKIRLYEQDGKRFQENFYFSLEGFDIDTNAYKVEDALSNVPKIKSNGKSEELYQFNYYSNNNENKSKECFRSDKEKYFLTTVLEDNLNFTRVRGVSQLSHVPDVCIKIEKRQNGYQVTIQDEFGKIDKGTYNLIGANCKFNSALQNLMPKYYHANEGKIYLIQKDCYLQRSNE